MVNRSQPWNAPPSQGQQQQQYNTQQMYQDMLARMRQKYQNEAQGIYNTMADQQANERLSALGLNFANDAYQQDMAVARMRGDIGQTAMQQQQARNRMLLDIAQTNWQREQQRLGMQSDYQRNAYGMAMSEQRNPFMEAMQTLGY